MHGPAVTHSLAPLHCPPFGHARAALLEEPFAPPVQRQKTKRQKRDNGREIGREREMRERITQPNKEGNISKTEGTKKKLEVRTKKTSGGGDGGLGSASIHILT